MRDHGLAAYLSHWRPISTVPCNQIVELRVPEGEEMITLEFPCLQTNAGVWIDVDLGTRVDLHPVEWRIWRKRSSPQPHLSNVDLKARASLVSRGARDGERDMLVASDDDGLK